MDGTCRGLALPRALALAALCAAACARIVDQDADTGLDAPTDPIDDPGVDTSVDSPVDPVGDTTDDTVVDTGPDAPVDTPYDTGLDTGYDTGYDTGFDTGYDPGYDPGYDTGFDTGYDPGFDTGYDTGYDTGFDTGYDTGYDPGYDTGYDPGYDPGDPDTAPVCPSGLTLATWDSGLDGWTPSHCAWARDSTGFMKYWANIGTTCYDDSYDHTVTSGSAVDLSGCSSATLSYSVMLSDDMWTTDADKSERLVAQCSPDGSTGWTNLTPTTWPTNQSACATSYCDGSTTLDRSFGWTGQSIAIPAACLTATARFRFRAWGANNWRFNYWGVDTVRVN